MGFPAARDRSADRRADPDRASRSDHRRYACGDPYVETSHPPSYYIPRTDIAPDILRRAQGDSFCEWKGAAAYWDVIVGDVVLPRIGWSYPNPTPAFAALRDHVAFYAAPFDRCSVDGETVIPQPGDFYGGWITTRVVGPFKGVPGSRGW